MDGRAQILFPLLTIQQGFLIKYEGDFKNGVFTHPYAANFISFIFEVDTSYRSLFGRQDEHPPFIGRIRGAIWEDLQMNKRFYDGYSEEDLMEVSLQMYKDLVGYMTAFIAFWACHFCGDEDGMLWEQIGNETNPDA